MTGYEYLGKLSYKNVEMIFVSSNITGGKKTSTQEYINSDLQLIEELGLKPRAFSVTAYIALVSEENDYVSKSAAILAALESPGYGVLVHPIHGIVPNVICLGYGLNETTDEIGIGLLQIEFGISNVQSGAIEAELTPTALVQTNKEVMSKSSELISEKFSANTRLLGVYDSAKSKLVSLGEKFNSSVKFAVKGADDVTKAITNPTDKLSNTIAEFQSSVVSLASNPVELAASITNVFNTINATIATASSAFDVYRNFFGFGWTDDVELKFDTIANRTKNNNNRLMNDSINAIALSGAYRFASQKDYKTTDEIDADIGVLESQLKEIESRPNIDSNLLASIWDVRETANDIFARARLNASAIINIDAELTSARSLSYLYYGDDESAIDLAKLNSGNGLFLDGPTKIFTK